MHTQMRYSERRFLAMPIAIFNPGLERLLSLVDNDLREHDEEFSQFDKNEWQSEYSLRIHHQKVAEAMRMISEARGVTDSELALRTSAALMHDLGKLAPPCHVYRMDRKLTPHEMEEVRKHSLFSAEHVHKYRGVLRRENLPFVRDVSVLVLHHHEPHKIWWSYLRRMAWDLMLADALVALTETRGKREGLRLESALKKLPQEIKRKVPLIWRILFFLEIKDALLVINRVYRKV